jgi:hypothetical protein
VTVADGSATTPSITNDGDTNTGIFFPAADTIAFAEGGVESVRIDASGNVGIGTSSPTAKLQVNGTGSSGTILAQHPGNNSFGTIIQASTTGGTDDPMISLENYNGGSPVRYGISCTDSGALAFMSGGYTGSFGTERMRIDSSGNFLVGTTSTSFTSTNYGLCFTPNASSFITVDTAAPNLNLSRNNNGDIFAFYRAGSQRGWISVETTGTTYGNLSDRRVKENFTDSPSALNTINQVKVTSFDWKEGGHTKYGFVAQDLNSVLPFAVTVGDDSDVIQKPWGIDNTKIVPYLTKAIQEQQALIQALTARITALENNNATQ